MTYESASEAEVLKTYWRPGAPLENTLFVMLDPYGRALTRGSRSPAWLFKDAHDMATSMDEVAKRYPSRIENRGLPTVASIRLAMNVAAADKRPLTIVVSDRLQNRSAMEKRLASLAWRSDLIGEMTYASGTRYELGSINGVRIAEGYIFISPNEFGTSGVVISQLGPTASPLDLWKSLTLTIEQHHPEMLEHQEHIRQGRLQGISWTSAIPVTDPPTLRHEAEMRNRGFDTGPGGFGGPPYRP